MLFVFSIILYLYRNSSQVGYAEIFLITVYNRFRHRPSDSPSAVANHDEALGAEARGQTLHR